MLNPSKRFRRVRVGIYVDAFNLYYGARDLCGRNTAGWRWLDIEKLVEEQLSQHRSWGRTRISRIVYCTALRDKDGDVSSAQDQKNYIAALSGQEIVHVEYGQYNPKFGKGVLTKPKAGSGRKFARMISPGQKNFPPRMPFGEVRGADGNMHISIHYASYEEKGSDVNLASHLLIDILEKRIDAAVVISNDGDLRHPLKFVRTRAPVALINPSRRPTSQMLKGDTRDGVGNHWWSRLADVNFKQNQLPAKVGNQYKPQGW